MKDRIQLLDIVMDIASTKTASEATIQYLKDGSSKVICFVNSETLLLLQENRDWQNIVQESELILPGNASVNGSVD